MVLVFFVDALKAMPPLLAIFLVSAFVSLLITIVYKFATNQGLMKQIHDEMKSLRSQIKETKDASAISQLNKRLMELTMKQAMHSMRSTLITMVPLFLIIGWMNANFAFYQAMPGEEFTTTMYFLPSASGVAQLSVPEGLQLLDNSSKAISNGKVSWQLKGSAGTYQLVYDFDNETYTRDVIITDKWRYSDPILEKGSALFGLFNLGDKAPLAKDSRIMRISVDLKQVHPFGSFDLFGWQPGWLATYILFTLLLTFPIRKLLKVH